MDRKLGLNLRVVCAESNFEPTSKSVTKNLHRAQKNLRMQRQVETPEEPQIRGIGGVNHLSPVRCKLVHTLDE